MKKISAITAMSASVGVILGLATVLPACGDDADDAGDDGGHVTLDEGPGAFAADFETSDAFFTRMSRLVEGQSPHGKTQIWYSSNLEPVLNDNSFTASEGTVSIKKFDGDKDGTVDGLAVMIKKASGYDSEHNDWYYEMRDLAGNVMSEPMAGKNVMCIGCHKGFLATDYLAGTKLR